MRPASRSASVSPTHEIGVRPLASASFVFFATPSSVSAKYWRLSEWPRITCVTPASTSIGAETSPVKAPSFSKCMFWAATATALPFAAATAAPSAV